jgi:N-acetylglucosamine-6-phosphate deacetylase
MELGRGCATGALSPPWRIPTRILTPAWRRWKNGYSDITHIYCGCSNVKRVNAYRTGGVVEAGLYDDRFTVQAIADGKHLPASLLKLVYKCKGADRITLITDALFGAASGLREGEVVNGANGLRILLEDGVMIMEDRQSFAGSACTTDRLVRTWWSLRTSRFRTPCGWRRHSRPHSGADRRKGSVAPAWSGYSHLLDHTLNVRMTMSMGRIVHDTIGIK